jgi:hypothetical protein
LPPSATSAGEGDGALDDVTLHHVVDDAERLGLGRGNGVAGEHEGERLLGPDQPRQALGAAGAGQQPELHLGQAHGRLGRGHPVVAAQGHLEAAAEGGAVDGGDDGLAAGFHRLQYLVQAGSLARRGAELGDVGAGNESTPRAGEDDGLDGVVGQRSG